MISRKNFLLFIICIFIPLTSLSTEIRVINLDFVITENIHFKQFISDIENDQLKYRDNFKKIEKDLQVKLEEIEKLKLILDEDELTVEVEKYNLNFNDFNQMVMSFNAHYEDQLETFKSYLIKESIKIIQQYSIENEIELILEANDYIVASNKLNITDEILLNLNKINLEIYFEKYK